MASGGIDTPDQTYKLRFLQKYNKFTAYILLLSTEVVLFERKSSPDLVIQTIDRSLIKLSY